MGRILPFCRPLPPRSQAGPLRCQFVLTSMPVGGAETLLVNLLKRLDRDRFAAEVVCLKEAGPLGQQLASEFPVHTELLSGKGLLRGKWDLRVLPRLYRLMRKRRIDAVITVGAGDKMFWGRLAAWLAGVPVIASALHSTGWPDGVGRLNRLLTPMTDAFIAVADSHGEFLRDFENFPATKVQVIRNGVDCERFRPAPSMRTAVRRELGLSAETALVGIVAALRPEKNHSLLIRAAARLRESPRAAAPMHWVIIGDGPERKSCEKLAKQLRIRDRVHFLGTRHDTHRLLAGLDVFALCSLNEASPVSILESLACEVPVVATDVGSVRETVRHGVTGLLVPSQDEEAFAAAVLELLADPATAKRMGQAGRELVVRSASLESMVAGYQRLITEQYDLRAKSSQRRRPATARFDWKGEVSAPPTSNGGR